MDKEKVLKSFEPLLKKCCGIYLKNFSDFEDAMQEGRIAILKCIENYNENLKVPFEAYVKRAVINTIRDFSRKIKDMESLDEAVTEDGENFYEIIASDFDLEGDYFKKEDIKRLYDALKKLTKKQREVIIEHFFKGKPLVEIAKNKRCHYMAVVRLKDRALDKLRENFIFK
ncbi:RNA polymerase sporulation-specific sigma factor [Caloramator fervidus]|uniref:RNA polymerase sporulation-specific sigma factor n=1 Tax=Caloramator fervidus TaxID=29344 RepID=A0A1H5RJP7_9CLOT|nr:sigma-70 family RNA polymerase sigma factor [Caloramator fervidus]SEF38576.1 RNA polymerase sporulation-specific sigma factor [Caloramator fervidus]